MPVTCRCFQAHVPVLIRILHLSRMGANSSDDIAYGTAFSIDFGVISILTRQDATATVNNFDSNGECASALLVHSLEFYVLVS